MVFFAVLLGLSSLTLALRTERSAPYLRFGYILMAMLMAFSAGETPPAPRTLLWPMAVGVALMLGVFVLSRIRNESWVLSRFIWDRSYGE